MKGIYQQLQEEASKNPPPKKVTLEMMKDAMNYLFNSNTNRKRD